MTHVCAQEGYIDCTTDSGAASSVVLDLVGSRFPLCPSDGKGCKSVTGEVVRNLGRTMPIKLKRTVADAPRPAEHGCRAVHRRAFPFLGVDFPAWSDEASLFLAWSVRLGVYVLVAQWTWRTPERPLKICSQRRPMRSATRPRPQRVENSWQKPSCLFLGWSRRRQQVLDCYSTDLKGTNSRCGTAGSCRHQRRDMLH